MLKSLEFGLELLMFLTKSLEVRWFTRFSINKPQDEFLNSGSLFRSKIEFSLDIIKVLDILHEECLPELPLESSSLLLKPVVVVLEHPDEFPIVINLFTIHKPDIFAVFTEVDRSLDHTSEELILVHELFNLVLDVVDMSLKLLYILVLLVDLLPQLSVLHRHIT